MFALAQGHRDPVFLLEAHNVMQQPLLHEGEFARARRHQEECLVLHGWSVVEQGRAREGIDEMRRGLAGWQATGALSHRPYQLALLAEALTREGRGREGFAALDEAQALSAASGE